MPRSFRAPCALLALGLSLSPTAPFAAGEPTSAPPAGPTPLNRRYLAQHRAFYPIPYDTHPAFVLDAAGRGYAVWHSYSPSGEHVVGRELPFTRDTPMLDAAEGGGIFGHPELAAGANGEMCVAWAACKDGRWSVHARRGEQGTWSAPIALSAPAVDALHPTVAGVAPGLFAVAWVEHRDGRFRAMVRTVGEHAAPAVEVGATDTDSFRPTFAKDAAGRIWVFWDSYRAGRSTIHARTFAPTLGPIEDVSTSPDRCLKPVATRNAAGELHAAWLKVTDVTGGTGVYDQLHSIEVARRVGSRWQRVADDRGASEVAVLAHGLLAQLEPKRVPTGGYLGRRRDPMLVRDGDAVWLLWERKVRHAGDTANVTGDLCGRRILGGRPEAPVVLARGYVDYRVAHDAEVRAGRIELLASTLPRDAVREYHRVSAVLADVAPLVTEEWQGWKRIELPPPDAAPTRHEVVEEGRAFTLVWMDSHVHSGLSADAEGEPDEILFYARDRGRLDALVMQENDLFVCPLTDGEYQTGAFYARALSRDGKFVALPGYEWTQQRPSDGTVAFDQPRFWGANYPNHRTVIYPRAGGPLVRYTDVRGDIGKLHAAVAAAGGIMHTQHASFDFHPHPTEVALEVTSGWGVFFLNPRKIHATLAAGHRAGFVGTSDNHRRSPGLGGGVTGLYVSALTPDAILEAYRARRVFATSGARMAIEARANGVLMGQETHSGGKVRLSLVAKSTRPLRRATLIRDGVDLRSFSLEGSALATTLEHTDTVSASGSHWYYWRVEQEGTSEHWGGNVATGLGNLAWSTPNWVNVSTP